MMKREHIRSALLAQGFVLLPGVFDGAHMGRLRDELDRARRAEEERFTPELLAEIGQDGYVSDVLAIGDAFLEVLESEALAHALDATLGPEARLFVAQGIVLDPGKGRGVWPRCWHADMYSHRRSIGAGFCFGVNCLLLVDDITAENGPTGLLPGSHDLENLQARSEDELAEIEWRAVAPSGSLLLIDGGTWHSAGLNRSAGPRRVVKMLFTREWIRPQLDYGATASPEVLARLSPRLRRMLRIAAAPRELEAVS